MHLRHIATGAALVVAFGSLSNGTAFADPAPVTTLYVDNHNADCTDGGTGTAAAPFCTIQAAADVVDPGQTVVVSPNATQLNFSSWADYAEDVSVTRSGTPGEPITFTVGGTGFVSAYGDDSQAPVTISPVGQGLQSGFSLAGVHDVVVHGFGIYSTTTEGILVSDSSDVTVDGNIISALYPSSTPSGGPTPELGVSVVDSSSDVTISRNSLQALDAGVAIGTGVTDATVTGNVFDGTSANAGVFVSGATGTAVTGNSWLADACSTAVQITGSSSTSVENNLIDGQCAQASAPAEISVNADSTSTTTLDYNIPYRSNGSAAYSWAGTPYDTAAALNGPSGQGAHDLNVDPLPTDPQSYEPIADAAVDSANAGAPGALATDADGDGRVDDPLIADTGAGAKTYYDRGAFEAPDPLYLGEGSLSSGQVPVGGQVTATVPIASDSWSSSVTETIAFGDGTAAVPAVNGSAEHTYTAPGTYTITATLKDNLGATDVRTLPITVVKSAPATLVLVATPSDANSLNLDFDITDPWQITAGTFDPGDGTAVQSLGYNAGGVGYQYSKPGTYEINVTLTDGGGNTLKQSVSFTTAGSDFKPLGPTRLLDTRYGIGTGKLAQVPAGGTVKLQVAGVADIPDGVTAVALNITATDTKGTGFVTAYADGSPVPNVSNLNYTPGKTVPNSAVVPVGKDGYIDLSNQGTLAGNIDLIADVTGYFAQTSASGYTSVAPDRLLDTRNGSGKGQVSPGHPVTLTIAGADGGSLPAGGVTAVALNVTTTDTKGAGYITAYPDGQGVPTASNLNYSAGQTVANAVIVPVGPDGKIDLVDGGTLAGNVDLIADVTGYFSTAGLSAYVPVTPVRALDTRQTKAVGPGVGVGVNLNATLGSPDGYNPHDPATGFVVNTTVTEPTGTGFVAAYPDGTAPPNVSTLNYTPDLTVANLALVTPGATTAQGGQLVDFQNGGLLAGTTELIVDLFGYFSQS